MNKEEIIERLESDLLDEKDNVYLGMSDEDYAAHLSMLIYIEDLLEEIR